MGGWDQARGLLNFVTSPTIDIVRFDVVGNVTNNHHCWEGVVVFVIIIIITQSYCESISISCNGWYWFGIFVNGTKLPWGDRINKKKTIERILHQIPYDFHASRNSTIWRFQIGHNFHTRKIRFFFFVAVARQIIEKLIEQSRRLKSIPSGVHSSFLLLIWKIYK